MNVLIIGVMYLPDLGPSAPLFTMLSEELVKRQHKVTVITMVPFYPTGKVSSAFLGKWIWRSSENGVKVIRIGLPSIDRSHLPLRILQNICYQLGAFVAAINQKYDVVISGNPALEVWLPFLWSVFLRCKPAIFSVNDVYPDVGIKLGIFKHRLVIAIVGNMERFCLKHSTIVHIISDSFRQSLQVLGVSESKISLIPLWADTNLIRPLHQDNSFAKKYDLINRFVIMYAGNIGLSQGLENMLAAAELLTDYREIQFVIVGDGSGRQLLQSQASQRHLNNVKFIPFQKRDQLPEVLASANVSLVILKSGISSDSLPSKILSIMASGRPIIVSVDIESETWKLVKQAGAGIFTPAEDPIKLAESIITLKNNKNLSDKLGQNGRLWVEQHHSPQFAAERFESILNKAISSHKNRI